jgi:hypothetical protein
MARTRKATKPKATSAAATESAPAEASLPVTETVTNDDAAAPIESNSPAESTPPAEAASVKTEEMSFSPPGRAWTERFLQPIKYSRSNFKHPEKGHLIAFRFELPPGETKPSEELLSVLRNHKVFKQGKPVGLTPDAAHSRDAIQTGLHYEDFGPRLGKLWVMPNGELGRTVADSLDQALYGLVKRIERGAARSG